MVAALEVDVGSAIAERRGYVEDEREEDVAMGVDIAPETVFTDGGEPFGEVVGFLEVEGNGEVALEVNETEAAVLFDKGQGVVVDVFHSLGCPVLVLERKDDVAEGVYDAATVSFTDEGSSLGEEPYFIIDAGDDFVSLEVEEALFPIAVDADAVFGNGGGGEVVGGCELVVLCLVVSMGEGVKGHAERVAGKKSVVVWDGEIFVLDGDDFVTKSVDDTPAVVAADGCETIGEGVCVLEDRREELAAESVDEGVEGEERVDDEPYGRAVLDEMASVIVLDGNNNIAAQVGVSGEVVFDNSNTVGRG